MVKLVALDKSAHQHLKIEPARVEEMGADLHMVPVVPSEFQKLVVDYPIMFSKNTETGHFVCVVLLGLEEGENLFWQAGEFNSIYIPLNITRHPFFVGEGDIHDTQPVICIDVESPILSEFHSEPLFDSEGQVSPYLQNAQSILAELIHGEQQATELIEQLLKHDLLVPLKLDIVFENGNAKQIKGMYSVDEVRLDRLDAESLLQLQNSGALQAIYTQLASLSQIYALIDKKNKRQSRPSLWLTPSGV